MPEVKRGWNEWAGSGVKDTRYAERVARAEKIKRDKIDELRQKRADQRLRGVVLNQGDEAGGRDKKFAHKYMLKSLPHPYQSTEQLDRMMDQPVGREWTTI